VSHSLSSSDWTDIEIVILSEAKDPEAIEPAFTARPFFTQNLNVVLFSNPISKSSSAPNSRCLNQSHRRLHHIKSLSQPIDEAKLK
jgi:hypothetical protein